MLLHHYYSREKHSFLTRKRHCHVFISCSFRCHILKCQHWHILNVYYFVRAPYTILKCCLFKCDRRTQKFKFTVEEADSGRRKASWTQKVGQRAIFTIYLHHLHQFVFKGRRKLFNIKYVYLFIWVCGCWQSRSSWVKSQLDSSTLKHHLPTSPVLDTVPIWNMASPEAQLMLSVGLIGKDFGKVKFTVKHEYLNDWCVLKRNQNSDLAYTALQSESHDYNVIELSHPFD